MVNFVSFQTDLLKIMMALETGEHLKVPSVDLLRVRAFRLEPLDEHRQQSSSSASTASSSASSSSPSKKVKGGHLTLDGESVEPGPVQARVEPRAINYLVKK